MATNPKLPNQRESRLPEDRDLHPKLQQQLQPTSRVPWILVAIVVAAAILLAMIIWLPRTPRATNPSGSQVPPQPTGDQVQLTNLTAVPGPTGASLYLEGRLLNTGPTAINGIEVDATFKSINGQNLETIRRPVEEMVGNSGTTYEPLANSPIKIDEARPFRISFDHVPEGWDHKLPALSIVAVTGVGNPGNGKLMPPILKNQGTGNSAPGSAAKPK